MPTTYVPNRSTGMETMNAGLQLMQWVLNFKKSDEEEKLLQQELQTGQLRQAALRMQNEQQAAQFGEWRDTSGMRMQALQDESTTSAANARKTTAQADLMQKELDNYDITKKTDDEIRQLSMAAHKEQLEKQKVDRQTAILRNEQEGPQFAAQMLQLKQQTAESKMRTMALKQGAQKEAAQQTWAGVLQGIELSRNLPAADFQKLKENPPDPTMAPILRSIPAGLTDPNKGIQAVRDGLMQLATSSGPEAAAATDTLSLMAIKEFVPNDLLMTMQVDPNTGAKMITPNEEVMKSVKTGIEAWAKSRRPKEPGEPLPALGTPPPPQANVGMKANADPKSLPKPLLNLWGQSQKYPDVATAKTSDEKVKQGRSYKEFISGYRNSDLQGDDALDDPTGAYSLRMFKLANKNPEYSESIGSRFGSAMSGGKATMKAMPHVPLLQNPEEQAAVDDALVYDKNATNQQHLMYMGLMREVAKRRNQKQPVSPLLDQTYRGLGGVDFFTPNQARSLLSVVRLFGE